MLGPRERSACCLRLQAPDRDSRHDELVRGPRRGWQRCEVEFAELAFSLFDAADQQQAPDFEIARMRGIDAVAVCFEGRARCLERLRRPAQVARDERDLGLGDDAPCAGNRFIRTEGMRGFSQQRLRPNEVAELRHCDAAKRKRRRVVTQRNPVQRAKRITRRERTRRGGDQRVHGNPATLVTPIVRQPSPIYLTTVDERNERP